VHELDLRWHRAQGPRSRYNARLVRYADDFVILARYIGAPILSFLTELLEGKMGLTLNQTKTRILDLREAGTSLDFLSYTFRFDSGRNGGDRYLNQFPSKKALTRRRAEVKALTCRRSALTLPRVVAELNRGLLSWGRYFSLGYPSKSFSDLDDYTRMRLVRFSRTRSQRSMRLPQGATAYAWGKSLGLVRLADPKVIAYLRGQGDLPQTYR
jgi:RNA-directed DNA polymerase